MSIKSLARNVVARRALVVAVLTAVVDLATVTLAYAAAGALRDRIHELPTDPLMQATIPGWLIVFFAYGLYSRKQILEPSLRALLSGITMSVFLTIVIAFAFHLLLARGWIVVLWAVSFLFVFVGRGALLRLTQLLRWDLRA